MEINNGMVRFDFPKNLSNGTSNITGTSSIINKNIIITAIANNINQKLYINSNLEASISNAIATPSISSALIYLGSHNEGVLCTKFNLGELIIYDRALSTKELDSVTKYLSKKWGIKI